MADQRRSRLISRHVASMFSPQSRPTRSAHIAGRCLIFRTLDFSPERDGFVFVNDLVLDTTQIDGSNSFLQEAVTPVVATLAPVLTTEAGRLFPRAANRRRVATH